jgi:hypothetical protein
MSLHFVKAQCDIPHASGDPALAFVNDFYFITADVPTTGDNAAILDAIEDFYSDVPTGDTNPLAIYLGTQISRTITPAVKLYDVTAHLDGSPAGSPYQTSPFVSTLPNVLGGTGQFPSEVQMTLTYKSTYGTLSEFGPVDPLTGKKTRPRAYARGRLYIGPVNDATRQPSSVTGPTINSAARTCLTRAATDLMNDSATRWATWSRRVATMADVVGGWVDDAYDTQRRRGEPTINRTTFGSLA